MPEENVTEVTEGGRLLAAYLKANALSIPRFCEAHPELGRVQVQRLVSGERGHHITARLALAIARATDGGVPVDSWGSSQDEKGA